MQAIYIPVKFNFFVTKTGQIKKSAGVFVTKSGQFVEYIQNFIELIEGEDTILK